MQVNHNLTEMRNRFLRSAIGFEELWNASIPTNKYPPHDIIQLREDGKDSNRYEIQVAAAGFSLEELDVETEKNILTITGTKADAELPKEYNRLYAGLASRNFSLQYTLAEHMSVTGAKFVNGILTVSLLKIVPANAKPKKVNIRCSDEENSNECAKE